MPTADGQVVNAVGNPRVIVRLMAGDTQQQMNGNMNSTAVQPNGTFEFPSVSPGSYTLLATTNGPNPHSSHRPVEVGHTNVDDVNLSIDPGISVAGRVRYDGDPPQPLPSLTVRMVPKNTGIGMGQPQPAKVDPDGSFHFDDVNPELYTVNINTPQNLYLKSVRSGTTDVLISGLDLSNGAGSLDILLGTNPPQVSGTVTNAETGQPAVAVTVLLVPQEKERLNQSLFYSYASTDQNGNFTFNRVMPGEYKAYAWEDVEYGKWYEPDFMKAYESKGEAVSAKENSPVTLKLNMIPAK
jgi:5-hydroxyisourate hydrolase-like protein (transthyretin family)